MGKRESGRRADGTGKGDPSDDKPVLRIFGESVEHPDASILESYFSFLSQLLEHVPDAIIATDTSLRITLWNHAAREIFGLRADEVLGRSMEEVVCCEFAGPGPSPLEAELAEKGSFRKECVGRGRDGIHLDLEVYMLGLEDPPGRVRGYVAAIRDISDRKSIEAELTEANRRYRSIYENMIIGIFQSSPTGRYMSMNQAHASIMGYDSPEEMIEGVRSISDVYVEPERRLRVLALIEEFGSVEGFEAQVCRKDGARIWISISAWAVRNNAGKTIYYEGVVQDITGQKNAEDALRESQELYRAFLLTSPDAVTATDLEGRITFVSLRTLELHGYETADELLGRSAFDLIAPEYRERAYAGLEETLSSSAVRNRRYEMLKSDGSRFTGELNAALLRDAAGGPKAFMATVRDITERQMAERKLERTNLELEGYAHTVSHDLRGPLTVITGTSEMLDAIIRRQPEGAIPPEMAELVELIIRNAEKSETLIEDLLTMAEAGQEPKHVSEVDVARVVDTVLSEKARLIGEAGARVVVAGDLGTVLANDTHVYQVFSNLIDNAVRHNDADSPEVKVECTGLDKLGRRAYRVRDNGSGITEEVIEDVFLPFHKGPGGETGMGLTIVQKIVDIYGGDIRARNDGGAVFEFSIGDYSQARL